VRASLRPLREVELTAARIADGDLSHRVPAADPRTEVGHLSGALNTMLSEIETAFAERAASEQAARESSERAHESEAAARRSEERMRRFIADASHELRTPLTTVRGFAELYRQGAVAEGTDTRALLARIEQEARRMGLLVEDLLLLARLDRSAHSRRRRSTSWRWRAMPWTTRAGWPATAASNSRSATPTRPRSRSATKDGCGRCCPTFSRMH